MRSFAGYYSNLRMDAWIYIVSELLTSLAKQPKTQVIQIIFITFLLQLISLEITFRIWAPNKASIVVQKISIWHLHIRKMMSYENCFRIRMCIRTKRFCLNFVRIFVKNHLKKFQITQFVQILPKIGKYLYKKLP